MNPAPWQADSIQQQALLAVALAGQAEAAEALLGVFE